MFNLGRGDYTVEKGNRIAQLIVAPYDAVQWEEGELGQTRAAPAAWAPPDAKPLRATSLAAALP